jgi:hypothetical protein
MTEARMDWENEHEWFEHEVEVCLAGQRHSLGGTLLDMAKSGMRRVLQAAFEKGFKDGKDK